MRSSVKNSGLADIFGNTSKDFQARDVELEKRVLTEATNAEETTLHAAIAGDPDAFAEIFHAHYDMIYALAYRICLNAEDARDIAQETFIKAARGIAAFDPRKPIRHWLYAICANAARDLYRGRSRRERVLAAIELDAGSSSQPEVDGCGAAWRALSTLSPALRETVVLVFIEQLTHGEAARILGCAETTVSWRIFRARRELRSILREP